MRWVMAVLMPMRIEHHEKSAPMSQQVELAGQGQPLALEKCRPAHNRGKQYCFRNYQERRL